MVHGGVALKDAMQSFTLYPIIHCKHYTVIVLDQAVRIYIDCLCFKTVVIPKRDNDTSIATSLNQKLVSTRFLPIPFHSQHIPIRTSCALLFGPVRRDTLFLQGHRAKLIGSIYCVLLYGPIWSVVAIPKW